MLKGVHMRLEDEIMAVVGANYPDWLTGYEISHTIERTWAANGRRSHFLWWSFPKVIGFGTLYRALDRLRNEARIVRLQDQPEGRPVPRIRWRSAHGPHP